MGESAQAHGVDYAWSLWSRPCSSPAPEVLHEGCLCLLVLQRGPHHDVLILGDNKEEGGCKEGGSVNHAAPRCVCPFETVSTCLPLSFPMLTPQETQPHEEFTPGCSVLLVGMPEAQGDE